MLGVRGVDIPKASPRGRHTYSDGLVWRPVGTVGSGGNSGFQALNLVAQWGARRIALVGFDMGGGSHWYGRNNWPNANNPGDTNFRHWIAAFTAAAPILAGRGIEVVNTSKHSALTCFPKASLSDTMARWL